MPDIDRYFDEIDAARIRRARELSDIKTRFSYNREPDSTGVDSKAALVLTYANWEGFYNDCVHTYVEFLTERGGKIRETDWMLLTGAVNSDFDSLRDRKYSVDAKYQFVANLKARLECAFDAFDRSIIEARSNLNFRRVTQCYTMLNFRTLPLEKFRLRIDRELVGWRHSVAHGDSPDLSALDIASHIDFASHLFIVVADQFQYAMLDRM